MKEKYGEKGNIASFTEKNEELIIKYIGNAKDEIITFTLDNYEELIAKMEKESRNFVKDAKYSQEISFGILDELSLIPRKLYADKHILYYMIKEKEKSTNFSEKLQNGIIKKIMNLDYENLDINTLDDYLTIKLLIMLSYMDRYKSDKPLKSNIVRTKTKD